MTTTHSNGMTQALDNVRRVNAERGGRDYIVSIKKPGDDFAQEFTEWFSSSDTAFEAGRVRAELDPNARVKVRVALQLTFGEGKTCYPYPLHPDATEEARLGWHDGFKAEQRRQQQDKDWKAVTDQAQAVQQRRFS